jgi:hypothetical protein
MGSPSDAGESARPRPTPELLARLRAGKAALREQRIALPLREKVRQLLELQRLYVSVVGRRRPLHPRERPWDIEP